MSPFKDRVVWRFGLMRMALFSAAGSMAMALVIVGAWEAGLWGISFAVGTVWLYGSIPWLILMAVVLADLGICAFTRKTLFLHLFREVAVRDQANRMITRKRRFEPEGWRRVLWDITMYSNPLVPVTFATAAVLLDQPPMSQAISSVLQDVGRGPHQGTVREWSKEWNDHIGPRGMEYASVG